MKEIKSYKLSVISYRDATYNIVNIVNNIVKILYGYYTCGDQLIMYINVESQCCTPETNIILYVKYTSI